MAAILDPAEILEIHKTYADEFAGLAQSGLTQAFSALSASGLFNYRPAQIGINFPVLGTPKTVGPLPKEPVLKALPKDPTLTRTEDIPNSSFGSAPFNNLGDVPIFNAPTKPGQGTPTFNVSAPNDPGQITLPNTPSYIGLPGLTLPYSSVNIPPAPIVTMQTFDGRRPNDIVIPDPTVIIGKYTTEVNDHRAFLPGWLRDNADAMIAKYVPEYTLLRTQINNAITNYTNPVTGGGAAIPANIEGAIYARHSDRNNLEFQRALDTAIDTIGKRGFFMPNGAMVNVLKQARMTMGDAQVRGSIDIATKNLELEQQNFQFMLKLGEQLEEKMIETITQYMTLAMQMDMQAISSAKEIVAAYLGAYNLQVMVYKALWEGYVADAEVYKAKISALEAGIRVYEAQIKAELAKTEINKATVEVLNAVATVNLALANSYKAQVEATLAPLEISRLQVAVFEARVRAYAAEVGAYESRWNAYKSEVEGEMGKFQAYTAQANAYSAQVGGFKAEVDAYSAEVSAVGEANRSIGISNESNVKVYTAQTDSAIKQFEATIASYSAQSNVVIKQSEIEVEYWRARSNLLMGEFNAALNQTFEYAREQMNLFRGQMEAAISAGNGLAHAANVAGALAGGAMSGLTSFAGSLVNAEQ